MLLDWLGIGLRCAGLATLLATLLALPLAWLVTHGRFSGRELLDAVASLPFLLPPAVLAYYLLSALRIWKLHFSWDAAVAVSAVYTLPVLLRLIRAGLEAVDPSFEDAARVLGAGEWRVFRRISLPLAWRALLSAVLAGFLRAFADFAATLILARNAAPGFLLLPLAAVAALDIALRMWRRQVPA